ncbi:hypothetical protein WA026_023257 [Henosepilachna vigintioctopunctata]|uniref:Kazal-like domain-containing protein n=1 Tax=Henosepilachna vigintioctopunctata TaxID=420089 RepID=A0AAW1V235_9CUCU
MTSTIVFYMFISVLLMGMVRVEILPDSMFLNIFDGLKQIFDSENGCDDCLRFILPIMPICASDGSNYPNNATLQCWNNCTTQSADFKRGIEVTHFGLCRRPRSS